MTGAGKIADSMQRGYRREHVRRGEGHTGPLTDAEREVLDALEREQAIQHGSVTTGRIAYLLDIPTTRARHCLAALSRRGMVEPEGHSLALGWRLT